MHKKIFPDLLSGLLAIVKPIFIFLLTLSLSFSLIWVFRFCNQSSLPNLKTSLKLKKKEKTNNEKRKSSLKIWSQFFATSQQFFFFFSSTICLQNHVWCLRTHMLTLSFCIVLKKKTKIKKNINKTITKITNALVRLYGTL